MHPSVRYVVSTNIFRCGRTSDMRSGGNLRIPKTATVACMEIPRCEYSSLTPLALVRFHHLVRLSLEGLVHDEVEKDLCLHYFIKCDLPLINLRMRDLR